MSDKTVEFPVGQRFDPRFLSPEMYPETIHVRPRYQDLDPLGHVNNVAMAGLFEDARIRFNHVMKQWFQTSDIRTMIAGQTLTYLSECHLHPALDFHIGIGRIGSRSWTIMSVAYQADRSVFCGMATLVTTRQGKAVPIPEGLLSMLHERQIRL